MTRDGRGVALTHDGFWLVAGLVCFFTGGTVPAYLQDDQVIPVGECGLDPQLVMPQH